MSWDTSTSSNGTYVLAARALDLAGNIGIASPVSVTISNTLNSILQDFPTRCAQPGVIVCQGFDDPSILTPTVYPASGLYPAADGTYGGTIDTTVAASGAGSLKFTIPSNGPANSAGYWRQLTTPALTAGPGQAQVFAPGATFYVQFQQMFSTSFLTNAWPQVGSGTTYWKQAIFSNDQSTCANEELTTVNVNGYGYPMMYGQCGADIFQVPLAGGDFLNEQGDTGSTGYNCHYQSPTPSTCFMYPANTWVTFYYRVTLGQWGQPNSTIQAWVALPGRGYQEWINITNHTLYQDAGGPGYDTVSLLPYMTGRDPTQSAGPVAYTWYDDLIISTQPIAAPLE